MFKLGGFLGGAFLLSSPAQAMSFEEFMADKERQEKQEALRKARAEGTLVEEEVEEAAPAAASAGSREELEGPSKAVLDEYKNVKPEVDTDPLKTAIVAILRVQESTLQEARLIKTGNFKDLQRNNIKMATRMMIDNSRIYDRIVKVASYVPQNKISEVNEKGRAAVEDLQSILDYFDERQMKVTEMSEDKKEFIVKALTAARSKFDEVLSYLPPEKIKAARDQVIMENELNQKELPPDVKILNPVFMN